VRIETPNSLFPKTPLKKGKKRLRIISQKLRFLMKKLRQRQATLVPFRFSLHAAAASQSKESER